MTYRNGTYIAFHAGGTTDPTASDMKYYQLLRAWHIRGDEDFYFVNSHDKTGAVRDTSLRETLRRSLAERLRHSKNMLLVLGRTARFDTDWVPFEIEYAVDTCQIPIIASYPDYEAVLYPEQLRPYWPPALASRISIGTAHVIHVPFKKAPLADAIEQFDHNRYPNGGGLGVYTREAYRAFRISLQ